MEGCIFCKKYADRSDVIYNNEYFWAQFDRFPVSPGHAEIIPISHIATIEDMDYNENMRLVKSTKELVKLINKTNLENVYRKMVENPLNDISKEMCEYMLSKPYLKEPFTDYNFDCNNGPLAGRTVDHLHFHIIPRHSGDVPDPTGGCRNIIPGMGNYKNWKKPEC